MTASPEGPWKSLKPPPQPPPVIRPTRSAPAAVNPFQRAHPQNGWRSLPFGQRLTLVGILVGACGGCLIALFVGLLSLAGPRNAEDLTSGDESRQVSAVTRTAVGTVCLAGFAVPVCGAVGALVYAAIGWRKPS
jgi:hypothetical protein